MNAKFTITDERLQQAFDGMKVSALRTDFRRSARKGLLVVRKQAVANYKKTYKGSKRWKAIWVRNYVKKSVIGAYVSLHKLNPAYADENKPNLLRWLNSGTSARFVKGYPNHINRTGKKGVSPKKKYKHAYQSDPDYRGAVKGSNFFTSAKNQVIDYASQIASNDMVNRVRARAKKMGLTV
jgi:hypothetical protein